MKKHVILFDIDGTLLHVHYAGRGSFQQALLELHGIEDNLSWVSFAGCTDRGILRQIFSRFDLPDTEQNVQAFFAAFPVIMRGRIRPEDCTVYPGVRELLETLAARPDVLLGLVTGNTRAGAMIKLGALGLDRFFSFGGFGDVHHDRSLIARDALTHAEALAGVPRAQMGVALFGDTQNDIRAAIANNVTAIGVGTSIFKTGELRAAGAHHAFECLAETSEVLQALGLNAPQGSV